MFQFQDVLASANTDAGIVELEGIVYSSAYNYLKTYTVKSNSSQVLPFESLFNIVQFGVSKEFICILDSRQTITFYNRNYLPVFTKRVVNIQSIQFSDDGQFFMYNSGNTIIILNSSNQNQIYQFLLPFKPSSVKFSMDNNFIVASNKSNIQIQPVQFYLDSRIQSLQEQRLLFQMFERHPFIIQSPDPIRDVHLQPNNESFDVLSYLSKLKLQTLIPEEFELINDKYSSGEFANFNLIVTLQSGNIQYWEPGFILEDNQHPFVSFYLKSQQNIFEEDQQPNPIVTTSHYNSSKKALSLGLSNGHYYYIVDSEINHTVSLSPYPITSILSYNNQYVAMSSKYEKTVKIYNFQTQVLETNDQTAINMQAFDISPDNRFIAIGQINGEIIIFDIFKNQVQTRFQAHNGDVRDIQFFKSSKALVSAGIDSVICYDLKKNIIFRTFKTENNSFDHVSVDPSGEIIAASDQQFNVNIFDLRTSLLIDSCKYHTGPISQLKFNPTGNGELYSTSWDKTLRIMDTFSSGKPISTLDETHEILGFAFMENTQVAVFLANGCISVFDVESATQINHINAATLLRQGIINKNHKSTQITSLAIQGDLLILGGYSKYLLIYNISNGKVLTMVQKLQISINLDFENIDSDSVSEQLRTHKLPQVTADERNLINLTQKIDLKTRRFFDPIQQIEQRKLEARVISIKISTNQRFIYVATSFGIVVFERKFGRIQGVLTGVNRDFVVQNYEKQPIFCIQAACKMGVFDVVEKCILMIARDSKQASLWAQIGEDCAAELAGVFGDMLRKGSGSDLQALIQSVQVFVQRFNGVTDAQFKNGLRSLAGSVQIATEAVRGVGLKGFQSFLGLERVRQCQMQIDDVEEQVIEVKVQRRKESMKKAQQ
ncbi:WD40 repeat protein [Spironucleus salmonicida]|uniref:Periodic tryptophan protein 2-like protein n=1 Tax=Spironucleus salmonicida TaxID=348837 RepID=V6LC81_9EUKA|nr:WD40 repeat protein [Spironucleus salmonicida]|eukprot:EST42077.1 Periodic tryptophan protein 2-like protein [Spironucleus salmonicida]